MIRPRPARTPAESSRIPAAPDRNESTLDAVPSGGWYKDAIIYELHVRAFHDGNGDVHRRRFQGADRKARITCR